MEKITIDNYRTKSPGIDFSKLPSTLREVHQSMNLLLEFYKDDPEIRETIDLYLEKLNRALTENGTAIKTKPATKKGRSGEPKKPKSKPKPAAKVKPVIEDIRLVGQPDPILAVIRRYIGCDARQRTVRYMRSFLVQVEKAVLTEKITRDHENYSEIKRIEQELQRVISKAMAARVDTISLSVEKARKAHYESLLQAEKVRPSVMLLKRYISLAGKEGVEKQSERLLARIIRTMEKYPRDKHIDKLRKARENLEKYLKNSSSPLPVDELTLAGISEGAILPASQLPNLRFNHLGLTGRWKELLGDVSTPFSMMVFGPPGGGKSTFSIMLAGYLAGLGHRSLYVASEEGFRSTLVEKFKRAGVDHPGVLVTTRIPDKLCDIGFLFIDSVNELGLDPAEISNLITRNHRAGISTILVYRGTKSGTFRGEETHENLVDISVKVENGETVVRKNRFGGSGTMKVY